MRGLDTNVLLRYLTADDPIQSAAARALFEEAEGRKDRFYVSLIALCELSWTLRGRSYRLDRAAIADVIERVLSTGLFEIQDRELARRALADYRRGEADFPDYLIGWCNRHAGCLDTVTFDRPLAEAEGFSLLGA